MNRRRVVKVLGWCVLVLLILGLAAPYFSVEQYAYRLQGSLERSLGRKVELGGVHFSLFNGPGFSIGRVVIHEDPSIGIEPAAYIEEPGSVIVRPSIWSLLGGRFEIASISLDEASINLVKSGPASEWGRWNFASLISPSVIRTAPAIHVRNGRIHFKFGDVKSVFYLTETDLDVTPARGGDWKLSLEGRPARSDRPAQGLGSFRLDGRWYGALGRAEMDLAIDRSGLGEVTALWSGEDAGVHGTLTSRIHLAGPLNNLGITGRLDVSDIHRWDMLPGNGRGWPLNLSGRLDLIGQQIELHSTSAGNAPLPLSVHFRATEYLSQPHWAVALNWNRFPVTAVSELARHMGAPVPAKLQIEGTVDGAIGYSGAGSLQGGFAFHDTVLTVPDSPPVRFEQAHVIFDHGHARLSPALVRGGDHDEARLEADWGLDDAVLDLQISTDGMKVPSLRAQVALANVPGLDQVTDGSWSGGLRYHRDAKQAVWTGRIALTDAAIPLAGLAQPLEISKAQLQIDGSHLTVDHLRGHAGPLDFTGDYRYEPAAARPHRIHLHGGAWDCAQLEALFLPTLRRSTNLLARTLGRPMLTDWLRQRNVDGTVQVDKLLLAGQEIHNLRARLLWDVGRVQLENLQAALDDAALTGRLDVNLRGSRPTYNLTARLKGIDWQGGKIDAEGAIASFGTGFQLLGNLSGEGTFSGTAVDLGSFGIARNVSGAYTMAWGQAGPRLKLTNVTVRTEDDTFTARTATLEDGKFAASLSGGGREMRLSGTLAKLRVE